MDELSVVLIGSRIWSIPCYISVLNYNFSIEKLCKEIEEKSTVEVNLSLQQQESQDSSTFTDKEGELQQLLLQAYLIFSYISVLVKIATAFADNGLCECEYFKSFNNKQKSETKKRLRLERC